MADEQSTTLSPLPVPSNTFNPVAAQSTPLGTPLAFSISTAGEVVPARANSVNTAYCCGLAATAGSTGHRLHAQFAGPLTLTAAEWDALTGDSGGLTPGVPYYVSQGTAGKLTKTAPVSGLKAPVGIAENATTLLIQISYPTTLS